MDLKFRTDVTGRLVQSMGGDASVVAAARVSTIGGESLESLGVDANEASGLLNFLMKNRHGCYDSRTEVLTADGWKFWPDVVGDESFATLNLSTDEIEYQYAERLVRKPINGPMVQIRMAHVDALVTPDHRMVSAPRTQHGWEYGLHPARDFLLRSQRVRLGGGTWDGDVHAPQEAALVGFIAADGYVGTSIEFHLHKSRKIEWLGERVQKIDLVDDAHDHYRIINPSERLRQWAKETYTETGERCFPRELLLRGDSETIRALLDGYLEGDGYSSPTGTTTCSTVSRQMVDDIQEAALKAGLAAIETAPDTLRKGAFGKRPLYRLTIYAARNMQPRVGWTTEARAEQVSVVDYDGDIHCVTVPNGTLYVRRNGKPMWCGNTPFEHNAMTFFVEAPIFVFREFHRHRIGWSYNEESARYKQLAPVFYVPARDRNLMQVGKPGAYEFVPGDDEMYGMTYTLLKETALFAYTRYERMLEEGVAKEVARMGLPVNTFSSMYATCNARSLMAFLSLRTKDDRAATPSFPQREIAMVAEQLEAAFAALMPITYDAFNRHGRQSP